MFTEPVLPLAVLIQIGKLYHSPRADQRVGFQDGPLAESKSNRQQQATERENHFHVGASSGIARDRGFVDFLTQPPFATVFPIDFADLGSIPTDFTGRRNRCRRRRRSKGVESETDDFRLTVQCHAEFECAAGTKLNQVVGPILSTL